MLMASLTVPMGFISILSDLVPLTVNEFETMRPDRFIADHYVDKLAYTEFALNELNGYSALSYRQGSTVLCMNTYTRAKFALGG